MDTLDFFNPKRKNGTYFLVKRNGKIIGRYLGKKDIRLNKTVINFIDTPNVETSDIIEEETTNLCYRIIDIDSKLDKKKIYKDFEYFNVWVESLLETISAKYNITANNSVVAVNSPITAPITISSLEQQIEKCSPEDIEIGKELIECLKNIKGSDAPIKKTVLQKFSDFFKKYSPIALSVGEIIVQILSQH